MARKELTDAKRIERWHKLALIFKHFSDTDPRKNQVGVNAVIGLSELCLEHEAEIATLKAELDEQIEQRASETRINDKLASRCVKAEKAVESLRKVLTLIENEARLMADLPEEKHWPKAPKIVLGSLADEAHAALQDEYEGLTPEYIAWKRKQLDLPNP